MSKSQRGASYYQTGKYSLKLRVFSEIFSSEMPHVESSAPVRGANQETKAPALTGRAETTRVNTQKNHLFKHRRPQSRNIQHLQPPILQPHQPPLLQCTQRLIYPLARQPHQIRQLLLRNP
jgi:hypothetical protein